MGRIPENLGQRIIDLARLATAMHLDALREMDFLRQTDASPLNRGNVLGWDGAALNGSAPSALGPNRSLNSCSDDSSDETNSANAEFSLESLSSRQWTRMGGAPLGNVMEDALSGQVDRAAALFGKPQRSAWCLDESASVTNLVDFSESMFFQALSLVWADSDDSNYDDDSSVADDDSTVADGAD